MDSGIPGRAPGLPTMGSFATSQRSGANPLHIRSQVKPLRQGDVVKCLDSLSTFDSTQNCYGLNNHPPGCPFTKNWHYHWQSAQETRRDRLVRQSDR